ADYDVVLRISQDGGMRHFAPRARGRGNADQRQHRARNLMEAEMLVRRSAVSEYHRDNLGQIHVAAAAQADDAIGLQTTSIFDGLLGSMNGWLGLAAVEDVDFDSGLFQRSDDAIDQP